jgi:hypothetical protein
MTFLPFARPPFVLHLLHKLSATSKNSAYSNLRETANHARQTLQSHYTAIKGPEMPPVYSKAARNVRNNNGTAATLLFLWIETT